MTRPEILKQLFSSAIREKILIHQIGKKLFITLRVPSGLRFFNRIAMDVRLTCEVLVVFDSKGNRNVCDEHECDNCLIREKSHSSTKRKPKKFRNKLKKLLISPVDVRGILDIFIKEKKMALALYHGVNLIRHIYETPSEGFPDYCEHGSENLSVLRQTVFQLQRTANTHFNSLGLF